MSCETITSATGRVARRWASTATSSARVVVETGERLVEHEQRALAREQPRQRDPALLTATEIVDRARGETRRQTDEREGLGRGAEAAGGAVELARDGVPEELQARVLEPQADATDLLDDRLVVEQCFAFGRREQPREQPRERRLPGAVAADDEHRIGARDVEVDSAQRAVGPRRACGVFVADAAQRHERRRWRGSRERSMPARERVDRGVRTRRRPSSELHHRVGRG